MAAEHQRFCCFCVPVAQLLFTSPPPPVTPTVEKRREKPPRRRCDKAPDIKRSLEECDLPWLLDSLQIAKAKVSRLAEAQQKAVEFVEAERLPLVRAVHLKLPPPPADCEGLEVRLLRIEAKKLHAEDGGRKRVFPVATFTDPVSGRVCEAGPDGVFPLLPFQDAPKPGSRWILDFGEGSSGPRCFVLVETPSSQVPKPCSRICKSNLVDRECLDVTQTLGDVVIGAVWRKRGEEPDVAPPNVDEGAWLFGQRSLATVERETAEREAAEAAKAAYEEKVSRIFPITKNGQRLDTVLLDRARILVSLPPEGCVGLELKVLRIKYRDGVMWSCEDDTETAPPFFRLYDRASDIYCGSESGPHVIYVEKNAKSWFCNPFGQAVLEIAHNTDGLEINAGRTSIFTESSMQPTFEEQYRAALFVIQYYQPQQGLKSYHAGGEVLLSTRWCGQPQPQPCLGITEPTEVECPESWPWPESLDDSDMFRAGVLLSLPPQDCVGLELKVLRIRDTARVEWTSRDRIWKPAPFTRIYDPASERYWATDGVYFMEKTATSWFCDRRGVAYMEIALPALGHRVEAAKTSISIDARLEPTFEEQHHPALFVIRQYQRFEGRVCHRAAFEVLLSTRWCSQPRPEDVPEPHPGMYGWLGPNAAAAAVSIGITEPTEVSRAAVAASGVAAEPMHRVEPTVSSGLLAAGTANTRGSLGTQNRVESRTVSPSFVGDGITSGHGSLGSLTEDACCFSKYADPEPTFQEFDGVRGHVVLGPPPRTNASEVWTLQIQVLRVLLRGQLWTCVHADQEAHSPPRFLLADAEDETGSSRMWKGNAHGLFARLPLSATMLSQFDSSGDAQTLRRTLPGSLKITRNGTGQCNVCLSDGLEPLRKAVAHTSLLFDEESTAVGEVTISAGWHLL